MARHTPLPKDHKSLTYHILKLMTHSIYSMPHDSISPPEVLLKTRQWLGISPFTKQSLSTGLGLLTAEGMVQKRTEAGKPVYCITDLGREVYDAHVDVTTVWKIEQLYTKPLELHTVSEVHAKGEKFPSTYIPEAAFFDWPLVFQPTFHVFEGNREIRVFRAFEKSARRA